jgi:hypothetical protein
MKLSQDKKTSLQNLNGKDLIYDRILAAEEGITTTRYYYGDDQNNVEVRRLLNSLEVDRMLIGHNCIESISTRCLGR